MRLKLLVFFTAFSLLCQVGFSLYYSIAIVDQNTLINSLQTNQNHLSIDNQQLEINLANLNSLSNFISFSKEKPYLPVNSTVNLNP